jgi:hypothetical protein
LLKNCALLGYDLASGDNFLPTFRDNLSLPSSWIKNPKGCLETSVRNYHYALHNNPEERSTHLLRGGSLKARAHYLFIIVIITIIGIVTIIVSSFSGGSYIGLHSNEISVSIKV